ncbi:MAG TPA: ABC transporter substrate-binding protein [Ilumatobacter sp.]|nr:ABC transporter substrate-binding protein [Ilumatobacter sp.]
MRRHSPLPLFAATALAVTLAACGGDDDAGTTSPAELRPVTLVLDWTPNTNHGGIYLADANGWYTDAGIDLEIIQPGTAGGLQAVATGSAEFAISVQESLVPAQAEGVPVTSVAAIVQHNTSSLLALASTGIGGPADLPGHRYGGWGGPLERALLDRLVECAEGDPTAVDFVEVGNTDYRVGLESGAFDVVWVYDGWDKLRLEQAGVDVTTIPFIEHADCIPDWYTPLIATSNTLVADDPELVEAFISATARGYDAAIADPGAAADALLAAAPELDEALVRASADYLAGQFTADADRWGEQSPEVWEQFVAFLTDTELLDHAPSDISAWYTNDFLP